jgi:glutamine synthetase
MLSRVSRALRPRVLPAAGSRCLSLAAQWDAEFGSKAFTGDVADRYLKNHGESGALLKDYSWTANKADKVAAAVMEWAKDHGATVYTHVFQPLGASGVRHGLTGQVHNHMFTFGENGKPLYKFGPDELLKGETDGSSYPNGGLRATHTAGGYTILDPSSPITIRGDTVFIPTIFISWTGHALDEKTPLLRAEQALNKEAKRLLNHLGWSVTGVNSNIGLEQEFFLVPKDAYARRLDLQMTGRTIMGKNAPRGQEMCDHYFAPLNQHASECIKAMQEEAFMMGIPLRTRHREVAPNQYEMAPYFGSSTLQIDQNITVMQICEEIAARYNLACLFQEKPFKDINGSGKHNNWSLGTFDGINLLNAKQVTKASGNPLTFPIVMASIIKGVDTHGDLMRAAIASPGNDFRLGACEAPPAVMSLYLGGALTEYLEEFKNGKVSAYEPPKKMLSSGVDTIPDFEVPAEDRNRTSPFPYGGHRFEFRAVGSAQNVSMVNTVLLALTAQSMRKFSEAIEGGKKPEQVAAEALKEHWKVIYNGNGYDPEWPDRAVQNKVWRIDSGVEATGMMTDAKNIALFEELGIMSKDEVAARRDVQLEHYIGTVEMEALCMIDMIKQQIIPALKEAGMDTGAVAAAASKVSEGLAGVHHEEDTLKKATLARTLRLETMESSREACDKAEEDCPAHLWPMATYKEMLFLDANQDANGNTI